MASGKLKLRSANRRINVWIVDDDVRYCCTVSNELNRMSAVQLSRTFGDCKSFLEALRNERKRPSVVLLDIRLPDVNGLDALPQIRQVSSSVKLIILTAFDNDSYVIKAVNEGADGFLLKHSSAGEMVKAIEGVYAGYKVLDPKVQAKFREIIKTGPAPTADYADAHYKCSVEACSLATSKNDVKNNERTIMEAEKYIDQCGMHRITEKEIAHHLGIHPSDFIRLFRRVNGVTPKTYIDQKLRDNLQKLLMAKSVTAWKLSYQLGFSSEQAFYRWIRRVFGVSWKELSIKCQESSRSPCADEREAI